MKFRIVMSLVLAFTLLPLVTVSPASAKKGWGCFKVTAKALNIRKRPRSKSKIIGTAYRGDILVKRKIICTPRGFWCAIWKGDLAGYADKKYMRKASCP